MKIKKTICERCGHDVLGGMIADIYDVMTEDEWKEYAHRSSMRLPVAISIIGGR